MRLVSKSLPVQSLTEETAGADFLASGVATLGHAGARALANSGRAPPVQR